VHSSSTLSCRTSLRGAIRRALPGRAGFVWLSLIFFFLGFPALLRCQQSPAAPQSGTPPAAPQSDATIPATQTAAQTPDAHAQGSLSGTISVSTGALLGGAHVKLLRDSQSPPRETVTGDDGEFTFADVAPGPYHLTITAEEFVTQTISGSLKPGEALVLQPVVLQLASAVTKVSVVVPMAEIAEVEIKAQEKQRALGVIPNFYVSYVPDAAPLTPKQKFELAWKSTLDPANFVIVGAFAGVQQASDGFSGYGQGAQGYAKRYGANFADSAIGQMLGDAVFPALFRQDPRYFYKGTGSKKSRFFYAIANAVICKSDRGHWQVNYSGMLGTLTTGGISYLYHPSSDRDAGLLFEGFAIGLGEAAVANLFQEFLVRKLTPHLPKHAPATKP